MFGPLLSHGHYLAAGAPNLGATKAGQAITGLIGSGTTWLAGLGAGGGALMIGYHGMMRILSGGDAQTDAHHLAAMKKVIVGTGVVVGSAGLAHFAAGLF